MRKNRSGCMRKFRLMRVVKAVVNQPTALRIIHLKGARCLWYLFFYTIAPCDSIKCQRRSLFEVGRVRSAQTTDECRKKAAKRAVLRSKSLGAVFRRWDCLRGGWRYSAVAHPVVAFFRVGPVIALTTDPFYVSRQSGSFAMPCRPIL